MFMYVAMYSLFSMQRVHQGYHNVKLPKQDTSCYGNIIA